MIKVEVANKRSESFSTHVVVPTIFPDGTSQVWQLPEWLLNSTEVKIIWNFENEREIIDLYSLRHLLNASYIHLHIPFLPYARQDKAASNNTTFNLEPFARLINGLAAHKVTSVDVHNPLATAALIRNFENLEVSNILHSLVEIVKPGIVVFPDKGAQYRYGGYLQGLPTVSCEKVRDQATGNITSLEPKFWGLATLRPGSKVLMIDDICDGGRTFEMAAKALREIQPSIHIVLYVTHGVFSKGKAIEGIDEIVCTNSLIKNISKYEV